MVVERKLTWNRILFLLIFLISCAWGEPALAAGKDRREGLDGDDPMMILVVGVDTRTRGYLYGLGDSVMVLRVDAKNQRVDILGFPRDLWVKIPDVEEDNGRTHGKLNQAYFFGTEGMGYYSGSGYGAGLMQATFKENWDFEIDHYIVVNMRIFREIIDALGGIEVYNPAHVYSFHQNQPKFLQGGYYFMGQDALMYARWRDPRNSYDRVDRQSIILQAVFEKTFQVETIPKIPEIVSSFKGNVLTDLHLAEISRLLYLAATFPEEEIRYSRIPKQELYWNGQVWLEKRTGTIQSILDQFQAGEWEWERN